MPVSFNVSWWQVTVLIVSTIAAPIIVSIFMGWLKIPNRVTRLEERYDGLRDMIKSIYDAIISKQFVKSTSPKQITDIGKKVLNNHMVDEFLKTCSLIQNAKDLKDQEELDIFLKCLEWVDKNGEKKIAEIMYENDISREQCRELLALAIRDKILQIL